MNDRSSDRLRRVYAPALLTLVTVLGLHTAGRVGSFCSPIKADSYVYGSVGYRLAQGEVFYRDVSDVKPPGLYLLYAAGYLVLPAGRASMIPVDSLFLCFGYLAVYVLARDLYGRSIGMVVTVAAALAINSFAVMDFATDAFGLSEGFMILPAVMAVRSYRRGRIEGRRVHFFLCGFWLGLEFAIKQTALPLLVAFFADFAVRMVIGRVGTRSAVRQLVSAGGGLLEAAAPFVLLVILQGTWRQAAVALGPHAARMLTLQTAWPSQWTNVTVLWVPMAWCVGALLLWTNRSQRESTAQVAPAEREDVRLLMIWLAAECVMLRYLPLRAFHYYILSSLPLVLLSGTFWVRIMKVAETRTRCARFACVVVPAVLSLAFVRRPLDKMAAAAVARYRSYDAAADRAYFDEAVGWGNIHFGGPPLESELGSRDDKHE